MPKKSNESRRSVAKAEEVAVIDNGGAKTVKRETSWVKRVWMIFAIVSVLWLPFVAWAPFYVRTNYGQPIKKSIVVSMFFDMQRYIQEQYAHLLNNVASSIDIKKPIGVAIEKVKIAEKPVAKVEKASAKAKQATSKISNLSGISGRFGVDTSAADKVIGSANNAVAKVDDTTKLVNDRLDKVKSELEKTAQMEIDKEMDKQIKSFLDKQSGGLGTTLLKDYGIKHVMPWKPSTWPITTKIYNDLEKSNLSVIQTLTNLVDRYFGYVMWGIMIVVWALGLLIWLKVMNYVKLITSPFIVCPRCGHTFTNKKRMAMGILKIFQPWKWFM